MQEQQSSAQSHSSSKIIFPIKSEFDQRQYETFFLENQLQVLLISDPETQKAAASMDVNVGHLSDPAELPGLAHFLEHMLFLGTEKYPDENSYHAFLSQHSGRSNAYTALEHTNYHFEVLSEYLEEGLDRFAQFFTSPLFTEGSTDREVKAVHSEHMKNLQVDHWRYFQLVKSTSHSDHPFSKFGTGSESTLVEGPSKVGINVRQALLDFHAKYYSANKMKLVVYGNQSIEQLRELVLSRFQQIPNKDLPEATYHFRSPFANTLRPLNNDLEERERENNNNEKKQKDYSKLLFDHYQDDSQRWMYHMIPVKKLHSLRLVFPIPPMAAFYKKKPSQYSSHLIGHEGAGSIHSLLKQKGWVYDLVAGIHISSSEFDLYKISLTLTDDGIKNTDEIISIIFQYISLAKTPGIQKWIYDEMKLMEEQEFKFKEKSEPFSYVTYLAGNMQKVEAEHCVCGTDLSWEYDPDAISHFWSYLVPSNLRIYVITPEFTGNKDAPMEKEPWYQTEYSRVLISESKLTEWSSPSSIDSGLHLPHPNQFIPSNFTIKHAPTSPDLPQLILSDSSTKVCHKLTSFTHYPK